MGGGAIGMDFSRGILHRLRGWDFSPAAWTSAQLCLERAGGQVPSEPSHSQGGGRAALWIRL